jgi:hypothetical protein
MAEDAWCEVVVVVVADIRLEVPRAGAPRLPRSSKS